MRKSLDILFTAYCGIVFLVPFLLLFPFIFLCIQFKSLHRFAHRILRFWSYIFFYCSGMPIHRTFRFKPDPDKAYVFVANHFTYLDIAAGMNILDNYFAYVGKSSVKKAPLFGYMFAKLHIQVDRSDKWSRTKSLKKSIDTLKSGRSIFIMPEGGIISEYPPQMHMPLKDGAFVMAIQNKVPVVPVTFLNNHEINKPLNLFRAGIRPRVIFNEPIETEGLTGNDIEDLKRKVYDIIQGDLDAYCNFKSEPYRR
jgi:1-acyl-sn-glycerol-3-phosphate acyltransferase